MIFFKAWELKPKKIFFVKFLLQPKLNLDKSINSNKF